MENNKVALVTGGMGGLGTAICRRLHAAGFRVAATYSPSNPTPEGWLAAQRDEGFRFMAYKVDVADYADTEWMMQKLLAECGRLDVLVNNAGITRDAACARWSMPTGTTCMRTNLDSVFNMSKQAHRADDGAEAGAASSISRRSTGRRAPSARPTMRRPRPACMA